jgi:flagellar protein FlaJ
MKAFRRTKTSSTGSEGSPPAPANAKLAESKLSFVERYNQALSRPWVASYRLLGERIARVFPLFEDMRPSLLRSGKRVHFEAYVSLIVLTSAIAFFIGFSVVTIIGLVLNGEIMAVLLLALAGGLLSGGTGFGVMYALPSLNADSRKRNMDEELPYAMSQMAVLAAAGLPPERIFRSLAQTEDKSVVAEESRMLLRDVDMLGFDLLTALSNARERSPSKTFAEFVEGFTAATRSGGDLKKYLLSSAKEVMELRRIAAKQLVEVLGMLAEAYVSMLVVFPLILIIMFSVMGLVGGEVGGFSVFSIMALVTYALIPMLAVLMLVLLDAMIPKR